MIGFDRKFYQPSIIGYMHERDYANAYATTNTIQ